MPAALLIPLRSRIARARQRRGDEGPLPGWHLDSRRRPCLPPSQWTRTPSVPI